MIATVATKSSSEPSLVTGDRIQASDRVYVATVHERSRRIGDKVYRYQSLTVRRLHSKVRGKAARRADKRARRLAREAAAAPLSKSL